MIQACVMVTKQFMTFYIEFTLILHKVDICHELFYNFTGNHTRQYIGWLLDQRRGVHH